VGRGGRKSCLVTAQRLVAIACIHDSPAIFWAEYNLWIMLVPLRLVQEVADDRAVAFIGSGLSLAAGLPDWPGLLKGLINEARARGAITDPDQEDLLAWLGKPDYLMLADALMHLLGRDRMAQALADRFSVAVHPTDTHRALTRIPFAAYITTNFDTLLEDAWSAEWHNRLRVYTSPADDGLRDPFRSGRSFLVKVHGDIGSPAKLVLGHGEFRRAIHDSRMYRIFLQDVFRRYTVLFLGYSLSDPDVLNMLDELVAIFGEVPGRHFALVDENRISKLNALAFDRNYGIEVLRYHKTAPTHPEVLDFVRSLAEDADQERRKQLASVRVQVSGDSASASIAQALSNVFQVDVVSTPPLVPITSSSEAERPATSPPAKSALIESFAQYCRTHLGSTAWKALEPWYEGLNANAAGMLLRANLDRESSRQDFVGALWPEFLEILARAAPSPERPFEVLQSVIESQRSRFLLRGKPLQSDEPVCRYMRMRHFSGLSMLAGNSQASGARETLRDIEAEDSNAIQIGELVLGKAGGPSWCTTPSFAQGRNAEAIARDLWDGAPGEPLVEIRYAADTLAGDDHLRVATVIDMYAGDVAEANILKPLPGEGDWCWTVRGCEAPRWTNLARAAVHPPLKLAGARAQTLQIRVIM
jgi:hypothetical protein